MLLTAIVIWVEAVMLQLLGREWLLQPQINEPHLWYIVKEIV